MSNWQRREFNEHSSPNKSREGIGEKALGQSRESTKAPKPKRAKFNHGGVNIIYECLWKTPPHSRVVVECLIIEERKVRSYQLPPNRAVNQTQQRSGGLPRAQNHRWGPTM